MAVLGTGRVPAQGWEGTLDADDAPDLTVAELTKGDGDGDEILKPVQGGEADDGVIEDASDLGEDEDDMSEAREHVDEAVADRG